MSDEIAEIRRHIVDCFELFGEELAKDQIGRIVGPWYPVDSINKTLSDMAEDGDVEEREGFLVWTGERLEPWTTDEDAKKQEI